VTGLTTELDLEILQENSGSVRKKTSVIVLFKLN